MEISDITILASKIIALSEAANWNDAKLEWELSEIYNADEPDTCLCNHFPIIEICIIHNTINGNDAVVGNVCVKKFMGLPSDRIFKAIKRVKINNEGALNIEAIDYARRKHWIRDKDYNFYLNTMKKRSLSPPQMEWRISINTKILAKIERHQ